MMTLKELNSGTRETYTNERGETYHMEMRIATLGRGGAKLHLAMAEIIDESTLRRTGDISFIKTLCNANHGVARPVTRDTKDVTCAKCLERMS